MHLGPGAHRHATGGRSVVTQLNVKRDISVLCRDYGKENGNYYIRLGYIFGIGSEQGNILGRLFLKDPPEPDFTIYENRPCIGISAIEKPSTLRSPWTEHSSTRQLSDSILYSHIPLYNPSYNPNEYPTIMY